MKLKKITKNRKYFKREIESQIQELSNRMSVSHPHEGSLEPKLYFMTVTFTESALITCPKKRLEYVRNTHEKFFMRLMGKAVKRYKKPKNRYRQPVSIDFYDFPGTKKGLGNTLKLPHTHSVLLIHPETIERFEEARSRDFDVHQDAELRSKIQSVDFQEIDTRDDLRNVVDYSSKFFRSPAPPYNDEHLHSLLYTCLGGEQASGEKFEQV
ncbi:hypothetical protein [Tritonibacter mobilis]|uniref:hypothetical protein n=1 Tax=Tritonibacter mobilis TaxID=379347 RepID=UPI0014027E67|nr:hypothetical protein [Tritonibacter mobilis]NHM21138.1 hypothetical protein [Tritonibacter mobilis]NHM25295.1 hypothetical protein [Tritonibacter mobilis]